MKTVADYTFFFQEDEDNNPILITKHAHGTPVTYSIHSTGFRVELNEKQLWNLYTRIHQILKLKEGA